jgi:hypothetical protein
MPLSSIFFLLWLCVPSAAIAQAPERRALPLDSLMRNVVAETDSVRKIAAMNDFAAALEAALRQDATMSRSFDSIPHLGILISKDKKVRIVTWNLPLTPVRHKYYGIVQYRTDNGIRTTVLQDVKETLATRPESTVLERSQWFGALYYDLLQHKAGKQSYYTLLGYDFHTGITHRKLLESVTFDDTGSPVFGAPLFDNGQWKAGRVLLEYSATSPFYLHYLPHKKMIVYQRMQWEQVAPGQPPAGVPTDVFDGLVLKNGCWLLQKDIPLTAKDF